jgi:hypothetical protein
MAFVLRSNMYFRWDPESLQMIQIAFFLDWLWGAMAPAFRAFLYLVSTYILPICVSVPCI